MADRDLRKPDHLPNLRDGKRPRHPSWLPRQRRGTTPQMIGRYPDYDVFDASDTWDHATRQVVTDRLGVCGPLRFFSPDEEPTLRAFCDTATAQDTEPRVPVAEMVDQKLADGRLDGYRYANMPRDDQTWRLVLQSLDETAAARHDQQRFSQLGGPDRAAIIEDFSQGELTGGAWEKLDVSRAWSVCMRAILAAFYSHPWAWNEIGFGGPAYPRGFMRLGPISTREPFEKPGATAEDPVRAAEELEP